MSQTNPRIKKIKIGKKELVEIKVYPLSIGDEMSFVEIFGDAFLRFSAAEDMEQTDELFVLTVIQLLKDNIRTLIDFVVDKDEWVSMCSSNAPDILSQIDNEQMIELVTAVYDTNFKPLEKKAQTLADKIKEMISHTKRSSIPSSADSSDTSPSIESKISTESDTKTGE